MDPEAFERAWPRPNKAPSDDALLGDSTVAREPEDKNGRFSYSVHLPPSLGQMPQDMERAWMKSDANGSIKGDAKNGIELEERERGSQSS